MPSTMLKKPVLLIILDGFGHREDENHNAIKNAKMPHWNSLWAKYAHSFINASEEFVGLPQGQMGNSEVGHLNIGAGRMPSDRFGWRKEVSVRAEKFGRIV